MFLFDLAVTLGKTVAELEAVLSEAELRRWMVYASVRPFGPQAAFLRTGILASLTANIHRDPKKGKPFTPQDFMPKPSGRPKAAAPARDFLTALKETFAGRIKEKPDAGKN